MDLQTINPDSIVIQKRLRQFDQSLADMLAESIREVGLINPLTIRRANGDHGQPLLIAGRHRLAAVQKLKWDGVSCVVMTSTDIERCRELIATYRDLAPGLVDSAVIATAERLDIRRVLTIDERDFRAVRLKGDALTLPPSDVDKK